MRYSRADRSVCRASILPVDHGSTRVIRYRDMIIYGIFHFVPRVRWTVIFQRAACAYVPSIIHFYRGCPFNGKRETSGNKCL